jgi:hypothetical protein
MVALPAWTAQLLPVDMDGAALLLGVSRRYLVDVIRKHQHFERRGVKKVFYPEHIAALKVALGLNGPRTSRETLRDFVAARLPPSEIAGLDRFLEEESEGTVYLLRCTTRVKIGFAGNFPERMRILKTSCPFPVEVVANFAGSRNVELFLHRCFAPLRRHGEWFDDAGDLHELSIALEAVK